MRPTPPLPQGSSDSAETSGPATSESVGDARRRPSMDMGGRAVTRGMPDRSTVPIRDPRPATAVAATVADPMPPGRAVMAGRASPAAIDRAATSEAASGASVAVAADASGNRARDRVPARSPTVWG